MCSAYWREASTVILAVLTPQLTNLSSKLSVLFLKRSPVSKFMPNGYVFPGGATHKSDESYKWLEIFKQFNINENDIKSIFSTVSSVPPMFQSDEKQFLKFLSLRITGIRETFEESGILLCRNKNYENLSDPLFASFIEIKNKNEWRTKIQNDPSEFINLCSEYKCFPDFLALNLWSNWLTPCNENIKRFDTAFFLAMLQEVPNSLADESEVVKVAWLSPTEALLSDKNKEIWLPPPQFYELEKINSIGSDNLLRSAFIKNKMGVQRWMPEQVSCTDGTVSLLPGDDKYPVEIDLKTGEGRPKLNMTMKEYRKNCKKLHRIEIANDLVSNLIVS